MIKRFVLFTMLAGLIAGCQSPQAPVAETAKEVEPPKQEQAKEIEAEKKSPESKEVAEAAPVAEPVAKVEESQQIIEAVKPAPIEKPAERTTVMILMKTSKGDIKLELDKEKAPKTVENFMKYVDAGHYKGDRTRYEHPAEPPNVTHCCRGFDYRRDQDCNDQP